MIPLSMLLKRKDNTEAAVATDSADCACACDAAPKKQQTLEQHLKQYHHGQMPKGDCSWLKQYKKDHPDWQKDAAKVSKGEAAVDTAKKDAAPKGKDKLKGSSKDVLKRFGVKEEDIPSDVGEQVKMVNKLTKFDEYKKGAEERDKKRIATAQKQFPSPKLVTRQAAGFNDDGTYNHEKDVYGFGNGKDYVEFTGKELDDLAKKGGKKDSASEYLDAVEKDRKSKKSDKKDGGAKKDDAAKGGEEKDALQKYPTKAEVSKHFDFEKAEKVIWGEVSKFDHIKNMDSDILGDGKLSLAFDMVNGGMFNKDCEKVLGDALEKLGIPRSDMERPTKGGSGNRAIVSVKLDSLVDPSLAKNDGMSPEEIIDNNSEEDIEAMFSDDTRKQIVANARKVAKKDGYGQYILWSPDLGWSFSRKYGQEDSFKDFGQEIMGEVELINDGNITYPEFHVNTDFDRMKPVRRYDAIMKALEARKKELAK